MRVNDGSVGRRGQNPCGSRVGDRSDGIGNQRAGVGDRRQVVPEDAKKALEAGRAPMEKAGSPEDEENLQQASLVTRVVRIPKDPCGASAILRTKRHRLRHLAAGSSRIEKQKKDAHARRVYPESRGYAEHGS